MTKIPSQIQLILNHKGKEITIKNDGSIIYQIRKYRNEYISKGKQDSFFADFERVTLDSICVKDTFKNLIKFEELNDNLIIDTFSENYSKIVYTQEGSNAISIGHSLEKTKSTLSKLSEKFECFINTPNLSELIIYFRGHENPEKIDNNGSIIDQICKFRNDYIAKGKNDSFFADFEKITLNSKCVKDTFIILIKSERLNENLIIDTFSKNCSIRIYTKWNCIPQNVASIEGLLQKNTNSQKTKSTKDLIFFLITYLLLSIILVCLIYSPTKDGISQSLASIVDKKQRC